MSVWYETDPIRFVIVVVVALAVGFGGGWIVHRDLHADDAQNAVCDSMTELYENRNLGFNLAYDGNDWEILKETYGEDAASAIMDARYSGGPMTGAVLYSAAEACGEPPSSN